MKLDAYTANVSCQMDSQRSQVRHRRECRSVMFVVTGPAKKPVGGGADLTLL